MFRYHHLQLKQNEVEVKLKRPGSWLFLTQIGSSQVCFDIFRYGWMRNKVQFKSKSTVGIIWIVFSCKVNFSNGMESTRVLVSYILQLLVKCSLLFLHLISFMNIFQVSLKVTCLAKAFMTNWTCVGSFSFVNQFDVCFKRTKLTEAFVTNVT